MDNSLLYSITANFQLPCILTVYSKVLQRKLAFFLHGILGPITVMKPSPKVCSDVAMFTSKIIVVSYVYMQCCLNMP